MAYQQTETLHPDSEMQSRSETQTATRILLAVVLVLVAVAVAVVLFGLPALTLFALVAAFVVLALLVAYAAGF